MLHSMSDGGECLPGESFRFGAGGGVSGWLPRESNRLRLRPGAPVADKCGGFAPPLQQENDTEEI